MGRETLGAERVRVVQDERQEVVGPLPDVGLSLQRVELQLVVEPCGARIANGSGTSSTSDASRPADRAASTTRPTRRRPDSVVA